MIRIYNTLTRKKEGFQPLEPGKVKMYVCGVTVYSDAHVGHAMSALVFDIIRRNLGDLNVLPATANPRATQTMGEIQAMISGLIEKGYAYAAGNGNVYFRVAKDEDYGRLSDRKLEDMQAETRIEVDDNTSHLTLRF